MSMPSPFEMGRAVGGNIAGGIQRGVETNAIDQILQQASASGNPEDIKNVMGQILQRIAPERRDLASQILTNTVQDLEGRRAKQAQMQAYEQAGLNPNLPESLNKELIKQKADENLWRDAISQRNANLGIPNSNAPKTPQMQQIPGSEIQPNALYAEEQKTEVSTNNVKPMYASTNVDPKLFRKDISKYETARLSEADKGYKRNESYLKTAQEQAETQPFIQDSIRQALVDVQSGNVSGALATLRSKLAQTFPAVLSAQEKNFENAMKNIALEQFASTPGFRSQGEFFVLQKVLPNLGDKQKSQEMNLKAILDSSLMKSKEEEVILDILNQSPGGEVPLNLREMVKERMDNEWKKLYARRYAEDPKIWDEYLNSSSGKNDPLFKDIKNVPVPQSSIDWKNYVKMVNPQGKKVAVHKGQVQQKLQEGYEQIQ